ncbi:hypothetical protein EN812_34755, partial [Mesorhizobium sp. M4B.F.Ca.ET.169.01.1.1]
MAKDRLASAPAVEWLRGAARVSAISAMMSSPSGELGGKIGVQPMWRNAQHLHLISAWNAMSSSDNHAMVALMSRPDLNLLVTLEVLLAEGSVAN